MKPVAPPDTVKADLMQIIRKLSTLDGLQPLPQCPGVSVSVVSRDKERSTMTVLLRFAPGARMPGHSHHGAESSYVVSGSCRIGDDSLSQGEFHRIEAGTRHGDVVSDNGCVLLITMDERDYRAA